MRAIRITSSHVAEIDVDPDQFFNNGVTWDCVSIDEGHDAWIADDSLSHPCTTFVRIGALRNVPLPAYVFGASGEQSVDATLDVAFARSLVRFGRQWTASSGDLPMIGFEMRIDQRGTAWPWRALISFPGERDKLSEHLIGIPSNRECLPSNDHPIYGDLRAIKPGQAPGADAIVEELRTRGHKKFLMSSSHFEITLTRILSDIQVETIDIEPILSLSPDGAKLEIDRMIAACADLEIMSAA